MTLPLRGDNMLQQVDNKIKDYVAQELQKFQGRFMSFRAKKITATLSDSLATTNKTSGAVGTSQIANGAVTQAKVANASIGQAQLRYEQATLAFATGDTSKTTSVTSGDIVIGVYSSTVSGSPAYGELQLGVSGTTLTGTRSSSPGGGSSITYTITLLKT